MTGGAATRKERTAPEDVAATASLDVVFTPPVISRPESQTRQHGIGSFNKGCRCDECKAACRRKSRARCRRQYQARERRPDDVMCVVCCCWFHEKGISRHEAICDG